MFSFLPMPKIKIIKQVFDLSANYTSKQKQQAL